MTNIKAQKEHFCRSFFYHLCTFFSSRKESYWCDAMYLQNCFFPRPTEDFDDTVSMDYLLPVASVKFFKRPIMGSDEMKLTTQSEIDILVFSSVI